MGPLSQHGLNPQELIVFHNALRPRYSAGLYLTHTGGHRQVGNSRIFGFA